MEIENINCTPPPAGQVAQQLLPEKSKNLYLKAYNSFVNWCRSKNTSKVSENVLLVYFKEYSNGKKASTLWSHFSMLKSTLSMKENIDISKFYNLIAFLKRRNNNYRPKKSSVFNQEEIVKFLREAPDEYYIATKAGLVIGVAGACRSDELCNMLVTDLNVKDMIVINIPNSKNGSSKKFVVKEGLWVETVKKYLKLRPIPDISKLFICISNGKATRQNIGHNTIGKMPNKIAVYLNLENPESYTGHSFRRTSATILAVNGGNILDLKQHGGWKSSTIAEGYIQGVKLVHAP